MLLSTSSESRLGSIWTNAVEVMLCSRAAGSDVYLVPSPSCPSPAGEALPPLLRQHVVYALTAFDPPGESRTLQENAAANGRLWQRILALHPAPSRVWPAWGYNLAEGWREDGFCLAYPIEEVARTPSYSREAVLTLAKEFGQGAIFEYRPDRTGRQRRRAGQDDSVAAPFLVSASVRIWFASVSPAPSSHGLLRSCPSLTAVAPILFQLRTTVPALSSDAVHQTVRVWRVGSNILTDALSADIGGNTTGGGGESHAGGLAHMLSRPWAGPADALTHQWTTGRA
jgi:hypothetical protein